MKSKGRKRIFWLVLAICMVMLGSVSASAKAARRTYYNSLSSYEKEVYVLMEKNWTQTSHKSFTWRVNSRLIYGQENKIIAKASFAFLYDHPEIFWHAGGTRWTTYYNTVNGRNYISSIYLSSSLIHSGAVSESTKYKTAVNKAVNTIKSNIGSNTSRYNTVKQIHDYVCRHASYDYSTVGQAHSSDSFFLHNGRTVCVGYAEGFKVLCDRFGVPCILGFGNDHEWDYVQMEDGKWYIVDTTWDDGSTISYDYFLIGKSSQHRHESGWSYPSISSSRYQKKTTYKLSYQVNSSVLPYTGKAQKPGVTVKVNGKTLSSSYYTLSYSNNVNVGRATVTVNGKGSYKNIIKNKKLTFRIKPNKPGFKKVEKYSGGILNFIWTSIPQRTGYELQVSTSSSFSSAWKFTKTTNSIALTNFQKYTTYYFRVRAYKTLSDGTKIYSSWSNVKKITIK